jgi:hypothetical protein
MYLKNASNIQFNTRYSILYFIIEWNYLFFGTKDEIGLETPVKFMWLSLN